MMQRCVIIGASPEADIDYIELNINKNTDFVICADAGYKAAEKAGIIPDLIVGDFDSSAKPNTSVQCIVLPTHKDDTDVMYAVKYALKKGYKSFLLLGVLGGRADHTYANLCILKYLYSNGAYAVIEDKGTQIFYTRQGDFTVKDKNGKTLSLFPFGCNEAVVTLTGFEYEIENQSVTCDYPYAISNIVKSDNSKITVHSGGIVILIYDL